MRKLDIHVHCNSLEPKAVETLIEAARDADTVIALSGGMGRYDTPKSVPNEAVLDIARRHPEWVIPLARFDLWDTPEPDTVQRYAGEGYRGLKFIYPWHEYDHDDYMPIYEAASDCNLPALFHTGLYRPAPADAKWKRPMLKNMNPVNLDRVARSFPEWPIVMAHLGTSLWRHEASELIRLHSNLYADLAGNGNWMAVSPEELVRLMNPVFPLVNAGYRGFRKLVLGSDAYVTHPHLIAEAQEWHRAFCRKIGLPDDVVKGIMGGTVAGWMSSMTNDETPKSE